MYQHIWLAFEISVSLTFALAGLKLQSSYLYLLNLLGLQLWVYYYFLAVLDTEPRTLHLVDTHSILKLLLFFCINL
jgi:hypothetical protein